MSDELKNIAVIGLDDDGKPVVKEPIFINISEFKNVKYLNIRKYYEENDQWFPTKKGLSLKIDQFEELIKILKEKESEIKNLLK